MAANTAKQLRYVPTTPPSNPASLSLYLKQELTKIQQAIAALAIYTGTGAASGEFYAEEGALIAHIPDRLLVGAASDSTASKDRTAASGDEWLSSVMQTTPIGPWPVYGAQMASLARYGTTGVLGASNTKNAVEAEEMLGYLPSSIGVASWGVADATQNPTNATAYAYYGEAWRMPGVNYQPTFAMELEAVNLGGSSYGETTPFHPNTGGGVYGIQLGSGGGQSSGASDAEAAITLVDNPTKWKHGLVFGATALAGTNGEDTGFGSAVVMASRQGIEWRTPETVQNVKGNNAGALLFSSVTNSAKGSRIEFSDYGLLVENSDGHLLFSVQPASAPASTLQVQAGSGAQAPGLYVEQSPGGSANLGLYPASGGELQVQSPVSGEGNSTPSTAPGGFMHINVNGQDWRIPLYSPAQAGG